MRGRDGFDPRNHLPEPRILLLTHQDAVELELDRLRHVGVLYLDGFVCHYGRAGRGRVFGGVM